MVPQQSFFPLQTADVGFLGSSPSFLGIHLFSHLHQNQPSLSPVQGLVSLPEISTQNHESVVNIIYIIPI